MNHLALRVTVTRELPETQGSISDYLTSSRVSNRDSIEFSNKEIKIKISNVILQNNLAVQLVNSPTLKELLRYLTR